jgi:hypothetical protein
MKILPFGSLSSAGGSNQVDPVFMSARVCLRHVISSNPDIDKSLICFYVNFCDDWFDLCALNSRST